MKIQVVNNTCDVPQVWAGGEIMIFFKDGKIVYHHDDSDGALETDYVQSLLKAIGIDIQFESIDPTPKQIDQINDYLLPIYGGKPEETECCGGNCDCGYQPPRERIGDFGQILNDDDI